MWKTSTTMCVIFYSNADFFFLIRSSCIYLFYLISKANRHQVVADRSFSINTDVQLSWLIVQGRVDSFFIFFSKEDLCFNGNFTFWWNYQHSYTVFTWTTAHSIAHSGHEHLKQQITVCFGLSSHASLFQTNVEKYCF